MSAPTTPPKKKKGEENENEQDGSYLVTYTRHLERRLRALETEKQLLDAERMRLERELHSLRNELDRLRQPPLISASLIEMLDDGRLIVKSSAGPQFVVNSSSKLTKDELKPGVRVALNQRTMAVVETLPSSKDPFVRGMEIEELPDVSYADIGGLQEQIREIRETVELPLTNPELFEKVGITPPKGVLLFGPPGTGKTLLARAVAHETKACFIKIISSELVQKFIGEGARLVREIFAMAKEKEQAIIFIDELDAIGSRRLEVATSGDREVQRTLMQLLSELDGFSPRGNIRIMAATNRPDILDPALLRPGRFDRLIEFGEPTMEDRKEIFQIHMRGMAVDPDVRAKIPRFVAATEKTTGADIKAICTEAGMFALRDLRDRVTIKDFEKAINKVLTQGFKTTSTVNMFT
nr:proteasome-activating nucleotidase [Candidatus Sigynarchaeota archaeon]